MRRIHRRAKPKDNQKKVKINKQIRVPEIQLIDENGEFLGTISTNEALKMAEDKGFDLAEVNPTAQPPIAKLIDFGKFKYEQEKRLKKQKSQQKKTEVKGLRLSFRIGKHDLEVRKKQAIRHITHGDKLKIEMTLRGRENQHVDIARKTLNEFIISLNEETPIKTDEAIKKAGNRLLVVIAPVQKQT